MDKYIELLQAIIDKQIFIMGASVVIKRARESGIIIDNNGKVTGYDGKGEGVVKKLISSFKDLSGEAAADFIEKAAKSVLEKNPDLKSSFNQWLKGF